MHSRKCKPVLLGKYCESTPVNDFAIIKLRHVVSERLGRREGGEKLILGRKKIIFRKKYK